MVFWSMSRYADLLPSPGKNATTLRPSASTDRVLSRAVYTSVFELDIWSSTRQTVLLVFIVNLQMVS